MNINLSESTYTQTPFIASHFEAELRFLPRLYYLLYYASSPATLTTLYYTPRATSDPWKRPHKYQARQTFLFLLPRITLIRFLFTLIYQRKHVYVCLWYMFWSHNFLNLISSKYVWANSGMTRTHIFMLKLYYFPKQRLLLYRRSLMFDSKPAYK